MSGVNFNDTDDTVVARKRLANASMRRLIDDGVVSQTVGTSYEKADFFTSVYSSNISILEPDLEDQQILIKSKYENMDIYEVAAIVCANANNNRTIYLQLIHNDNGTENIISETSFRRRQSNDVGDSAMRGFITLNNITNQSVYINVRSSNNSTNLTWRAGNLIIRRL